MMKQHFFCIKAFAVQKSNEELSKENEGKYILYYKDCLKITLLYFLI